LSAAKRTAEARDGIDSRNRPAQNERNPENAQTEATLYLLEEPTIGLHMADVELLLKVLHRLVDEGHTVIVIEHNLSIMGEAITSWTSDPRPERGRRSGGDRTPEEIAKSRKSRTAPFCAKC